MQDHHRLVVWQKARMLASLTYRATESLPDAERFGLKAQMRRAAVPIPSNIAEGAGRVGDRDSARFLRIAYGSASELETQALLAGDVGVAPPRELERVIASTNEVRRMLDALIHRVSEQPQLKAQSSRLEAQGSKLKARSSRLANGTGPPEGGPVRSFADSSSC